MVQGCNLHVFIISPGKSFKNHTEVMQGQSPAQPDHSSLLVLAFSPPEDTTSGTEVHNFLEAAELEFLLFGCSFSKPILQAHNPQKNAKHLYRKKNAFQEWTFLEPKCLDFSKFTVALTALKRRRLRQRLYAPRP